MTSGSPCCRGLAPPRHQPPAASGDDGDGGHEPHRGAEEV